MQATPMAPGRGVAFFGWEGGVGLLIEKVLNNNAAVVLDESGREVIVMGSGIAFRKKAGSAIDPAAVDKVFTLTDRDTRSRFKQIIKEIPMEYVLLSEKAISSAKIALGRPLADSIYTTLTDHIATVVGRHREGLDLKNPLMWDIKQFYPDEFQVGLDTLALIEKELGVQLLEDEAAFIAFHFVNAQTGGGNMALAHDMTKLIQEIVAIVKGYFQIEYHPDSLTYFRFINHLKFFAQRLFQNAGHMDEDNYLLDVVKLQNPEAYACTLAVGDFIRREYSYNLSDSEVLYMTIHIARIQKETARQNTDN